MFGEPFRHEERAKRDECGDEYREADCGDGLGYSDCTCDGESLDADEEPDLLASDGVEWVIALDEAALGVEIPELCEDAVGLDRAPLCET